MYLLLIQFRDSSKIDLDFHYENVTGEMYNKIIFQNI